MAFRYHMTGYVCVSVSEIESGCTFGLKIKYLFLCWYIFFLWFLKLIANVKKLNKDVDNHSYKQVYKKVSYTVWN